MKHSAVSTAKAVVHLSDQDTPLDRARQLGEGMWRVMTEARDRGDGVPVSGALQVAVLRGIGPCGCGEVHDWLVLEVRGQLAQVDGRPARRSTGALHRLPEGYEQDETQLELLRAACAAALVSSLGAWAAAELARARGVIEFEDLSASGVTAQGWN